MSNEEKKFAIRKADGNVPNRLYRRVFVYVSMGIAWGTAFYLALHGAGPIAQSVADAMTSFLLTMGSVYVLGHSVDRSAILESIGKAFSKSKEEVK